MRLHPRAPKIVAASLRSLCALLIAASTAKRIGPNTANCEPRKASPAVKWIGSSFQPAFSAVWAKVAKWCVAFQKRFGAISANRPWMMTKVSVTARTGPASPNPRQGAAAAVILAHNHPSGVAEPSQADELITARLREALALVDIRVLDHCIVGDSGCLSFCERGLL